MQVLFQLSVLACLLPLCFMLHLCAVMWMYLHCQASLLIAANMRPHGRQHAGAENNSMLHQAGNYLMWH